MAAANKQTTPNEEEEKKIPVFTVLKNNAIVKNIFILDNAPSIPDPKSITSVDKSDQEMEEILTVGRHPDCNIMLTHPSISRFHLRIHSQPSSQKLYVIDLSSVHGTWVSEKKIEPGFEIELKEGDTIRMGGSSRVYRLHWVPLSRAYDLDHPFVSSSDLLMMEEEENENLKHGQEDDSSSVDNGQYRLLDSISEVVESSYSDENFEFFVKREVPSAPPMQEDLNALHSDEEEILKQSPQEKDSEHGENLSLCVARDASDTLKLSLLVGEPLLDIEDPNFDKENQFAVGVNLTEPQPLVVTEVLSEIAIPESPEFNSNPKSNLMDKLNLASSDGKEGSLEVEMLAPMESPEFNSNPKSNLMDKLNLASSDGKEGSLEVEMLAPMESPVKRDHEERDLSGALETEYTNLSLPSRSVLSDIENQQFEVQIQSPEPLNATDGLSERESLESPPIRTEKTLNLPSIWSRRGKPASVLELQTGRSKGEDIGVGNDDDVKSKNQDNAENNTSLKALCFGLDRDEDEIFTPDKENRTPNTLLLKSIKRSGMAEEKKHSMLFRSSSSKVAVSPIMHPGEDMLASSDKENQTPKVLQERKPLRSTTSINRIRLEQEITNMKKQVERVPFQSLLVDSAGKGKSEVSVVNTTARSSTSVNCGQSMDKGTNFYCNNAVGEGKRRWYMVVDTSCLLNRESRKALELLQGLRGTQLIIPRMVVRELDCLKRRGCLFRRKTEVSSVLQWIEECMVSTKWWIHVQSSLEEGTPIAPTPPASPQSRFSEGSVGILSGMTTSLMPFSAFGSLMDVVSPTAEDHILDSALYYRRLKNDGQLVLLSNDVTLKIKAMAEGLICETAEEFRESLVNPFSERFLWAESSPRGQTWSCSDDIVLKEKYYGSPKKKATSKGGEGVKGLKLILLHNSHYGKIKTVS